MIARHRHHRVEPTRWRDKSLCPTPILTVIYVMATAWAIGLFVAFPTSTTRSISFSDFIQVVRTSQIAEGVEGGEVRALVAQSSSSIPQAA